MKITLTDKDTHLLFSLPQLAAPDSWLRNITNDSRITSPGVAKRLKQPLVGLSILHSEASLRKDLVAIQLTKAGDLFYQLLVAGNNTALIHDNSHRVPGSKNSSCDNESSTSSSFIGVCIVYIPAFFIVHDEGAHLIFSATVNSCLAIRVHAL